LAARVEVEPSLPALTERSFARDDDDAEAPIIARAWASRLGRSRRASGELAVSDPTLRLDA
jgi:hypothetical protein